jgi:hypothetical protein
VDRKKGAGSPPGELGSFDLAKMSDAEVAAQIAARMVQWRRAHKPPAARASGPPAAERPAVAQPADRPYIPPPSPSLGEAAAIRIDRALRMAAGRLGPQTEALRTRSARLASGYRTDFEALLAEGPNMNAAGMRPAKSRIDVVLGRALNWGRALGVAAWRAPMHWPAIAGAALIAAAIAGWILMPSGRTVVPEASSAPEAAIPPVALHPPDPAPGIAGLAAEPTSASLTPARQEAIPPDKVASRAAPPVPAQRGPTLVARLKPAQPAAAAAEAQPAGQATKQPDARQQDTVPLNATPQAPGAADNPHRIEQ